MRGNYIHFACVLYFKSNKRNYDYFDRYICALECDKTSYKNFLICVIAQNKEEASKTCFTFVEEIDIEREINNEDITTALMHNVKNYVNLLNKLF